VRKSETPIKTSHEAVVFVVFGYIQKSLNKIKQ
jgi:hypothetical protein